MVKVVSEFIATCRENKRSKQKTFNIPTEHLDELEAGKKYLIVVQEVD